ncbi:MAG: YdcF family protein [Bryobacterales bacterium]|nr:YdcF family protein [Bryobacterales bacterium]
MKRYRKWAIAFLLVIAVAALTWRWWLPLPGEFLVDGDAPVKSDGIVVLAGDGYGYRVQTGAELAKQGYAPLVLTSGAAWIYGVCECDLAIDYAVRNGQPRELFEPLRNEASSTETEIHAILVEAQRRNWKSILVVTSDYHTRRTRFLMDRLKPDSLTVNIVGSPDRFFRPEQWWWHRESRKTFLSEWTKLGAALVGGL